MAIRSLCRHCRMGIRIATAPAGPRNDRRCYMVRRDCLSSSVIARSEATWQSVLTVGTACTGKRIATAPAGPRNDRRCCMVRRDSLSSSVIARSEATRQSALSAATAVWEYGLPRPLRGLAMTGDVDGVQRFSIFLCHCEERSDVAIRSLCRQCRMGIRIATAPAGPRNDNVVLTFAPTADR